MEVAHTFLKHWLQGIDEFEKEDEQEQTESMQVDEAGTSQVEQEEWTIEKAAEQGFYNVERIENRTYKQGWRFLTIWEGYEIKDATWEPIKSFLLPDGKLNHKFQEYRLSKGLDKPLRTAINMANKQSPSME